jgi:hypothetical protein
MRRRAAGYEHAPDDLAPSGVPLVREHEQERASRDEARALLDRGWRRHGAGRLAPGLGCRQRVAQDERVADDELSRHDAGVVLDELPPLLGVSELASGDAPERIAGLNDVFHVRATSAG